MSGGQYTTTPNLGLIMPNYDMDDGLWGYHLNNNASVLDSAIGALQSDVTGGPFLPLAGGSVFGVVDIVNNPFTFINTSPFETHVLMAQIGSQTPLQIALQGGGTGGPGVAGYFNGISSAITVPAGNLTPSGAQAFAGFVHSSCAFLPGTQSGPGATALYGMAVANGSNVHVWGGNIVINDGPNYAKDGSTSQVINGLEIDVNMYNGGYADPTQNTAIQVNTIHLNTRNPPRPGSFAYSVACGTQYFPVSYAFASLQGSATNALYVGPTTFFPPAWIGPITAVLNQTVQPTVPNGLAYVCTVPGVTGATEPVWPASGSVTDGAATWTYQRTLADTSQAILWNYVDGSATPTQRQIRMQVLPTVQGGNLTITGAPGTAGITASGGVVSNGPSETGFSFNVPYNSAGNNAINYNSASNSVTNLGLALGAVQTVGNTNNAGMSSQKIQLGFSNTAAATVQNYQMVVAPTATGGTLQFNATGQDANLFVKTGLQVGSPTGGMGTVGTVKASGAGTFNGGFGVFTTTTPVTTKPTLTGAWAGNTAGKALATLLASYGLLTDSTSA